ncbi:MAG: 4-hydroxy-3-methylbut-2-enyl diphosphate reductase [Lachnospiraceae bacterium]
MQIEVAKTAGFCFGVKRAVDMVYEQVGLQHQKPIYTYGPIIHNAEVVKDLEAKGVQVIENEADIDKISESVIVIRSHGIKKRIYDRLTSNRFICVDATCPFVKKIHNIVEKESQKGKHIIIIGNESHPEVEGIKGWSSGKVTVIETTTDAKKFCLNPIRPVCIVSQTTFNYKKFKELVEIILEKGYDVSVLNTICSATKERQEEARDIAERVEAMIVIGDKQSSNTQKLFEICNKACNNTYYIQTLDDLNMNQLESVESVGITAGASTPNNIIEEVQNNVRINF